MTRNFDPVLAELAELAPLRAILTEMGRVVVAFSGGIDSTFLLKVAVDTLGDRAVALTAVSESLPPWELDEARALAAEMGAEMIEVQTHEMARPGYRANAGDRCYHCKSELFNVARVHTASAGLGVLCYGAIPDDLGDHRPGMQAADEGAVRAPLIEAGLDKVAIRRLSKRLGLSNWDKPAAACLSSRFPTGTTIDGARLAQVTRCEAGLRALGLRQFRARYHDALVRVEVGHDELPRVFADATLRSEMVSACKAAGFRFVSLDLEGYRLSGGEPALVQIR